MKNDPRKNLPNHLWIDQHGQQIWARTVSELRMKAGGGAVTKMYSDKVAGPLAGHSVHSGYVVGKRWFSRYAPVEIDAGPSNR